MKKISTLILIAFCFNAKAQLTTILNFNDTNGAHPHGDMYYDGTYLYGMTYNGGLSTACSYGCGTIFKIKPDGTGYANLLVFNSANGSYPNAALISDGTFLYGMTQMGGASTNCGVGYGCGTIFKIKPDGTGYDTVMIFKGAANGQNPDGSLYYDGTYLYGMTWVNGANSYGTIFKIKPNGTGYTNLLSFNITNGESPSGSLISDGTFLYGTTERGGANNNGLIFKIKPDGTGYVDLLDFSGTTNGSTPYGTLYYDGTFLYGTTGSGGINNQGTIFKIKTDGTGYTNLFNFNGTNGSGSSSTLYYDGTYLYGMTSSGGANGNGTIFKIKPDGTGFVDLLDFSGPPTNGSNPVSSLISDGTFLYGMTNLGGTYARGTVFKIALNATNINQFTNNEGQIMVYPNPASNSLEVSSSKGEITQLQIVNMLGQIVWQNKLCKMRNISIDISSLQQGVYFIQTNFGTQKFIKQ